MRSQACAINVNVFFYSFFPLSGKRTLFISRIVQSIEAVRFFGILPPFFWSMQKMSLPCCSFFQSISNLKSVFIVLKQSILWIVYVNSDMTSMLVCNIAFEIWESTFPRILTFYYLDNSLHILYYPQYWLLEYDKYTL